MFLKFSIKFLIYTKGGGAIFDKLEMIRCFIFNCNSFLKFLSILDNFFLEKIKKEKKKKIYIS